ncbi:MAG: hypothetical protein HY561_07390 [Gemmatimonadetes bacterium]|nr:hypothetical protein [Gemmatimonadota bacterium]
MSRKSALALVCAATLAPLLACKDELEPPIPVALAADWQADPGCAPPCAFTLSSGPDSLDLVRLGSRLFLALQRNGGAELEFVITNDSLRRLLPGADSVRVVGVAWTEGDGLFLRGPAGTDSLIYTLTGDVLRLEFRHQFVRLDLNGDAIPDSAATTAVLRRR